MPHPAASAHHQAATSRAAPLPAVGTPAASTEGEYVSSIDHSSSGYDDEDEEEEDDEDEGMFSFLPPDPSRPGVPPAPASSLATNQALQQDQAPQYFYQPPPPPQPKAQPKPQPQLAPLQASSFPPTLPGQEHASPTSPSRQRPTVVIPPGASQNMAGSAANSGSPTASLQHTPTPFHPATLTGSPPAGRTPTMTSPPEDPLISPTRRRAAGGIFGHGKDLSGSTLGSPSPRASKVLPSYAVAAGPLSGSPAPPPQAAAPDAMDRHNSLLDALQLPHAGSPNNSPASALAAASPLPPPQAQMGIPHHKMSHLHPSPEDVDTPSPPYTSLDPNLVLPDGMTPAEAIAARYRVNGVGQDGMAKRKSYNYVPESPTWSAGAGSGDAGMPQDYVGAVPGYPPGNVRPGSRGRASMGSMSPADRQAQVSRMMAKGGIAGLFPEGQIAGEGIGSTSRAAPGMAGTRSVSEASSFGTGFTGMTGPMARPFPMPTDDKSYLAAAMSGRGQPGMGMQNMESHPISLPPNTTISDLAMALEDEEDSPYAEVRASVSNIDDPEMPALTFRTWAIGMLLCIIGVTMNNFFTVRYPAPYLTVTVVQVVAYPIGKAMAYFFPTRTFRNPDWMPRFLGGGQEWSFNPGPFNIKEHASIVIIANTAIPPAYAITLIVTMNKFYNVTTSFGFDLLLTLSTQIVGFGFAGICRRFLVWPGSMVWPQVLVTCTLLNTFHAEEDDGRDGKMTRYRFFLIVATGAFVWYFFPGWIFNALSAFSWVCWIWPNNIVVNQLFGVSSGLGMGIFTFDWSQISYIGSPFVVPWWATLNIMAGFIFFYWIICPILYYTNTWYLSYLPMTSDVAYDRFGNEYDAPKVIGSDFKLNETAYQAYSPPYLPAAFAVVYALAFALVTSAVVHTVLYHGKSIVDRVRNVRFEEEDVHAKLMRYYPEVPDWWYWVTLVICGGVVIFVVEVYNTGLPVWGVLLALCIASIYILPGGFIYAMTSQLLSINLIAELIPGYLLPGKPIPNMMFKLLTLEALQGALQFVLDLKLGHYMKIPPRATFALQLAAAIVATFVQVGVKRWLVANVPTLCTIHQKDLLICPQSSVFFTSSIVWGLVGPERQFGPHSLYHSITYFLLVGALLPLPFYFMAKRWPRKWFKYINIPVLLVGATYIPPATGINYSSWFIVALIFQWWMRKRHFRWWSKFNFVTSAGLDTGTILCAMLIFFTLQLPRNGTISFNWWGNDVFRNTMDWEGTPLLQPPSEGFGLKEWH